jgi:hypothetical protein
MLLGTMPLSFLSGIGAASSAMSSAMLEMHSGILTSLLLM